MTSPEQSLPSAQEAYEQNYSAVCELILSIGKKLESDHESTRPKHWGDVGDLGYAKEVLQDLGDFLGA